MSQGNSCSCRDDSELASQSIHLHTEHKLAANTRYHLVQFHFHSCCCCLAAVSNVRTAHLHPCAGVAAAHKGSSLWTMRSLILPRAAETADAAVLSHNLRRLSIRVWNSRVESSIAQNVDSNPLIGLKVFNHEALRCANVR
eukprot:1171475-Amphidinium_carterae.1